MNSVGYFEIQSSEPVKSIDFYSKVFHWKFIKKEWAPIEYYRIGTNGVSGGLLKRPAKIPPPESGTNAFTCSIEVSNFDQTAQLILENSGQVALPKFAVPKKCWQRYFIDTDGNVFGLFEVDENAG
ncbi:MAG: VOC family protein [Chitinophagales bacterium]